MEKSVEKLFRRIWSAEKASVSAAKYKAINELLFKFGVSVPLSPEGADSESADIDKLGDSIGSLMAMATEFDLSHPNNLGVVVSKILAEYLETRLHMAGINEFDGQLQMMQGVNIIQSPQSMGGRSSATSTSKERKKQLKNEYKAMQKKEEHGSGSIVKLIPPIIFFLIIWVLIIIIRALINGTLN